MCTSGFPAGVTLDGRHPPNSMCDPVPSRPPAKYRCDPVQGQSTHGLGAPWICAAAVQGQVRPCPVPSAAWGHPGLVPPPPGGDPALVAFDFQPRPWSQLVWYSVHGKMRRKRKRGKRKEEKKANAAPGNRLRARVTLSSGGHLLPWRSPASAAPGSGIPWPPF